MGFRPQEVAHFFSREISRLGTPWSPSYDHIYKTNNCWERLNWVIVMVKKSVKNYIEWCSQSTKRLIVGQRYEDISVISYQDIM